MENYDKQITSEVTKSPKNKKKIIFISVIAAVVVILILLSSLIPALILNTKIESLMEAKETSDLSYFEFKPYWEVEQYKDFGKGYIAYISTNVILPEIINVPNTYQNEPIIAAYCTTRNIIPFDLIDVKAFYRTKKIIINEGIEECCIAFFPNLESISLPKSIVELKSNQFSNNISSIFYCPNLIEVTCFENTVIDNNIFQNNPNTKFTIINHS